MYFNDVHIIYYVVILILGALIGKIINWVNYRLSERKKILSLDFFRKPKHYKQNYLVISINAVLYVLILYKFGIKSTVFANLELVKYLLLTPMLLSVFTIDYRSQRIPNRLNLTIFEIGLVTAFLYSINNTAITINMLLGMLGGVGIFLIITLLSKLIFGKDSIGLGDLKFMGALGLFFGVTNTVVICLISFFLAAIVSIILLIAKIKKTNDNMSFGPFIVIASIITILVPLNTILAILARICTLGLYQI